MSITRTLSIIVVLAGLTFGLKLGIEYGLYFNLRDRFERETGSTVDFDRPRISLMPIGALTRSISFRSAGEQGTEGLYADEASIRLDLREIFRHRIVLHDLNIHGIRAESRRADSSFIRLLDYIIRDSPDDGWPILISSVHLAGVEQGSLLLAEGEKTFSWNGLELALTRRSLEEIKSPAFHVAATAADFGYRYETVKLPVLRRLQLDGVLHKAKFQIGSATTALGENGRIEVRGEIDFEHAYALQVQGNSAVGDLDIGGMERLVREAGADFSFQGGIGGALADPAFDGAVRIDFRNGLRLFDDCAVHQVGTNLRIDESGVAVRDLSVDSFSYPSELSLAFDPPHSVSGRIAVDLARNPEYVARCFPSLGGRQQLPRLPVLEASASGALSPLNLSADLRGEIPGDKVAARITWGGDRLEGEVREQLHDTSRLHGKFSREGDAVRISELHLTDYPALLAVRRLSAFLEEEEILRLETVITEDSKLDVEGWAEFGTGDPTAEGSIALSALRVKGVPVKALSSSLKMSSGGLTGTKVQGELLEGRAAGSFVLSPDGKLQGDLKAEGLTLVGVSPVLPFVADLTGELGGSVDKPQYSATLNLRERGTFTVHGDREAVRADGAIDSGALELRALVALTGDKPVELQIEARNFRPTVHFDPMSAVTGTLEYRAKAGSPLLGEGSLRIDSLSLVHERVRIAAAAPLRLQLKNGRAAVEEARMRVNDREIAVTGYADLRDGWNARVAGRWDIGSLFPRRSPVEQIAGDAALELQVTGPLEKPEVMGDVEFVNGAISVRAGRSIVGVSDLAGRILLRGQDARLEELSGTVGEGRVSARGTVENFLSAEERRGEIDMQFSQLALEPAPQLTVVLGGTVSAKLSPALQVGGNIQVESAIYERRLTLAEIVREATQTILGLNAGEQYEQYELNELEGANGEGVAVDLRVKADNSILVDADVLKAEVAADLVVSGTTGRPRVAGDVVATGGSFGFGNTKFDLLTGRLRFSAAKDRIDPEVDILGESLLAESQRVSVAVSGTLSEPRVSFSSDTGLRDREILVLLGAGNTEGGTLLSLQAGGTGALERVFTGVTGFSAIDIGYGYSSATGSYVPKVTATRPLVGQVSLELESEVGKGQTSTAGVKYPLSPRVDIFTGYRDAPTVHEPSSNSGSFDLGIRYRGTFPDLGLVPRLPREER